MDRSEEILDNPDSGVAEHIREYVATDGERGASSAVLRGRGRGGGVRPRRQLRLTRLRSSTGSRPRSPSSRRSRWSGRSSPSPCRGARGRERRFPRFGAGARGRGPELITIDETMTPLRSSPVVHLELHTADLPQARELYAELCGWRPEWIETRAGSYLSLELGDGFGGGIVECPVRGPLWLPYVEVDEIVEATDRARGLGASVLLEPREGPAGWRSVVATPVGGEIAFWQPKARRAPALGTA